MAHLQDPIPHSERLLDQVRHRIRLKHYSIRTEQAYVDWIRRYIYFHGKRHPASMGAPQVEAFLTDLAVARHVAAATQNQARSAILFLYKEVLAIELPWLDGVEHAKPSVHLPVVLTREEVARVLERLAGTHRLIGALLYGSGMRIMEGIRLRVKDLGFARGEIVVRDGKGAKDRITMLPRNLSGRLRTYLEEVHALHGRDLADGFGATYLPAALQRKYPAAAREWGWQYVSPRETFHAIRGPGSCVVTMFPIRRSSARCGKRCATPASLSRRRRIPCAIRSRRTCSKQATTSVLSRTTRAFHVSTTMIYTHVLNRGGRGVVSPLDAALRASSDDGIAYVADSARLTACCQTLSSMPGANVPPSRSIAS